MTPAEAALFLFSMAALSVAFLTAMILMRYKKSELRHQERLAVIEKGGSLPALDDERPKSPWTPRVYLLRGMLWTSLGVAITLVLASISLTVAHPPSQSWRLAEAQALRTQGATEEQVKQFLAEEGKRNDGLPLSVASVGLIPISVGLAYLLFYRKESQSPLSLNSEAELPSTL